ncbi:MAG: hypothetical protein IPK01_18460 [Acidobacteria bacterium]|nr:hypothetical protein [Acidobacteriota bacterium]
MRTIEANYSFWKSSAGVVLLSAALFGYYLFLPEKYKHFVIPIILGSVLLLSIYVMFRRFSATRPVIRIDEKGLTDNRSGVGFVPWSAIKSAEIRSFKAERWIAVMLKDPDVFSSEMGPRAAIKSFLWGADLKVQFSDLDIGVDDAFSLVSEYLGHE